MGEYTGAPVTVRQVHYVYVQPEEWDCPPDGITVEKLRELLDHPEFSVLRGSVITIGAPGEAKAGPGHEGMVEIAFTFPVMEC